MKNKNIIPEGTRDLVLKECENKRALTNAIEGVLEKWGYKEVITPSIEFYQTFNGGNQNLREEDMYKFFDEKGRILVLRPDMTIPIARVVATKFKDVNSPLRIRYASNVFRVHESLGGKKNEYTDCGVELINIEGVNGDVDVLVTALQCLKTLKGTGFKLEIGNINLFNSAVKDLSLDFQERSNLAKLIDEKSMKGLEDYLDELSISNKYKEFFMKLPWLFGGVEILEEGCKVAINNETLEAITYLKKLYNILNELGYGENLSFDLGIVPRLNYYTGIIFKGYVEGVGVTVLSGGRYDNLLSTFGKDVPAVGFSINIDSLITLNISTKEGVEVEVYYGEKSLIEAIKKSEEIRSLGKVVKLIPDKTLNEVVVKEEVF